jgi:hypothetical protein
MVDKKPLSVAERTILGILFSLLTAITGLVVYFSDKPINPGMSLIFLYEFKIAGLDPLDYLTLLMLFLIIVYYILRRRIIITTFHKYLFIIFIIYAVAMIVGYVYGLFLDYPFDKWIQDLQFIAYLLIYFIAAFEVFRTLKKWLFFYYYLIVIILLNGLSLALSFYRNKMDLLIGFSGITAIGTDLVILAIPFFAILTRIFFLQENPLKKIAGGAGLFIYIFDIIVNQARTIWLLFVFSLVYFIGILDLKRRIIISAVIVVLITGTIAYFQTKQPKFWTLTKWRISSLVDVSSTQRNLSNATRVAEVKNVIRRLIDHASFVQGMGLGAWWDGTEYRLPPGDWGSGFIGETRYYYTHLYFLSQLLKIGLAGTIIYWVLIVRLLWFSHRLYRKTPKQNPLAISLLGLNIAFFHLAFCMASYLRVFLFMGLILALIARLHLLMETETNDDRNN